MSFTVISTFSGLGGSSLGYKLAGGKILLSVEWDDHAVKTYKKNFSETPIYHGNISDLSIEKIFELTNLKPKELDIFDGSPPCQGFSTAGKRIMKDERNNLFQEYCRILKGLQPKCFVMENVSGLIKGNMKFIFVEILKNLKECGYNVKAKLLNSKNFHVPQSRQRLIFIGIRKDLEFEPSFPKGSKKIITLKQALKNVPKGERLKPCGFILKIAHILKAGEKGSKYHPKKSFFSTQRLSWNYPSPTILKQTGTSRAMIFHPDLNESLSIEEVKRIFSFPDEFILEGSFIEKWARLGNCVPPNFMKAIALHLYENVIKKIYNDEK